MLAGSPLPISTPLPQVTDEMTLSFMACLRAEGIQFVVAPYEADSQLAYMQQQGDIDCVVTEDSDLLVFGCKILTKMSAQGFCIEYALDRIRQYGRQGKGNNAKLARSQSDAPKANGEMNDTMPCHSMLCLACCMRAPLTLTHKTNIT